jgi:membrane protein DedA with SNARE-associated domain
VTHLIDQYGLLFLFGIVALESAGAWVPGETALIAAAVLAAQGHLSIELVIVVAALAAILGDNVGYWIGRKGGRKLAERFPWLARFLPAAERFFERHGGKAVFFARFLAGLRVTGAWMAGIGHMSWWRFLGWNALGGIVWATAVALVAYYGGKAAADAIARYGLFAAAGIAAVVVLGFFVLHYGKKRLETRL